MIPCTWIRFVSPSRSPAPPVAPPLPSPSTRIAAHLPPPLPSPSTRTAAPLPPPFPSPSTRKAAPLPPLLPSSSISRLTRHRASPRPPAAPAPNSPHPTPLPPRQRSTSRVLARTPSPAPDFACSVEAPSSSPVGSFHLPIPISPGFGDAFAAFKIDGARFPSFFFAVDLTG